MLHEKILIKSVDLAETKDIYAADLDSVLIAHLKKYEGHCSDGMLILRIVRILARGSVVMCTNLNNGYAQCDVKFLAEGILLLPREVLHRCRIIEIHNSIIIASHKYAGIKIDRDDKQVINKILQVGQEIPVIIERACYTINQPNISVVARPYVPIPDRDVIYAVNGMYQFSAEEIEKLEFLFNIISKNEELVKRASAANAKQFDFFRNIMFPYQQRRYQPNKKDIEIPCDQNLVKNLVKHMKDNSALYIYYPATDDRVNKRFFLIDAPDDKNTRILKTNLYSAMYHIYSSYCMYIQTLHEFIETYRAVDDVKKLGQYWNVCMELKKKNDLI